MLKDWCEILTNQDLDIVAPRQRVRLGEKGWTCWHDSNPIPVLPRFTLDFDYGAPLSQTRWNRLVMLAGAGTQPEIEHLLLRDARSAQMRGRFRRAVLDAATAIEIALYRLLKEGHRQDRSRSWAMRKLWKEVASFRDL